MSYATDYDSRDAYEQAVTQQRRRRPVMSDNKVHTTRDAAYKALRQRMKLAGCFDCARLRIIHGRNVPKYECDRTLEVHPVSFRCRHFRSK